LKIGIVGGGIFGLLAAKKIKDNLKNNVDITIFEFNDNILKGASANNLNRIHLGYHYPRSKKTAYQSKLNYYKFIDIFEKCIRDDIKSYYFIAKKNSKVNFSQYVNFCNKIKLPFKEVNLEKIDFKVNNILGGIETNEAVYDIDKIRNVFIKFCKKNSILLSLKNKVTQIYSYEKKVDIKSDNFNETFDFVLDTSHIYTNSFKTNLKNNLINKRYQKTLVLNVKIDLSSNIGAAVMDGNFVSFLPNGFKDNHLLYDVENSVIFEKNSLTFNPYSDSDSEIDIEKINSKIFKKFNFFFPDTSINEVKSSNFSYRLLPVSKVDERVSKLQKFSDNFLSVSSTKVDHSIELSDKIYEHIKNNFL
tara:strand:+ start:1533 stop:2615 length:1083 start_codon:yes stop_codon:yes gene_type:complete